MAKRQPANVERSQEIRVLMEKAHNVVGVPYTKIGKDSGVEKTLVSKFMNNVLDFTDERLDAIEKSLEKVKEIL